MTPDRQNKRCSYCEQLLLTVATQAVPEAFEANQPITKVVITSNSLYDYNLSPLFLHFLSICSNCSFWYSDQHGNGKQIEINGTKADRFTCVIDINGETSVFVCSLCLWCSQLYL